MLRWSGFGDSLHERRHQFWWWRPCRPISNSR